MTISFENFVAQWLTEAPNRKATYGHSLSDFSPENLAKVRKIYEGRVSLEHDMARRAEIGARMEKEREEQEEAATATIAERRAAIETLVALISQAFSSQPTYSGLSDSVYLDVEGVKVRISDHETRPTYGKLYGYADVDVAIGYHGAESHVWLLKFDADTMRAAADDVVARINRRIQKSGR